MNYIKIDVNGVLKTDKQLLPMTAGDTNNIVILTDYDQEVATPYLVTAYVKRYDGLVVGPISCLEIAVPEEFEEEYIRARELKLDDTMLAVEGFVECSIIYEEYDGETLVSRKTAVKFAFYCNESIRLFFNDYDAYEEFKESILLKDFSGLSLESSITDAMQFILKTDGTAKVSTFANLVTYLKTQNTIKEVADVDSYFESGIVVDASDNVVVCSTSGGAITQIGIINGEFTIRSYAGGIWTSNPSFIPVTQKGEANGVATLNESGKIPLDQMPDVITQPAKVFNDLNALLADLDLGTEYEVGTSFYLREMTQFDFWYTGVAEDDPAVAWYGYKISPLEAKTDLTDYVKKETGKELIPSADLLKLQATDPFHEEGTYPGLTAGKAYNLEGAEPYLLDEAFDLRVTAGEDTEVTDGIARVKTLEAVVTADADGVITNITPKPNILVVTNDNWLKVVENYSYTNKGITIEWVDENTLKFSGTATETGSFSISPFVYNGLTENTLYDAEAKLYANVLSGDIESGNFIEFASAKVIGTDAYADLNLASQIDFALNGLFLGINITNEVSINDLVVRFYTKHASNPNQKWLRPNPLEYSLYTSELVEATDWFKENSINYETKEFTKYWHKYIIDGSEATWSFYGSGSGTGTYVHILELTTDLTDLLLTSVAGSPYAGVAHYVGRASAYGTTNMVAGDVGILFGTDLVNGIVFATELDLNNFKAVFSGSYPLPVWIKYLTPTITALETIDNEIAYPAYNYGLEFGLLGNKLGVEYSSDFQKQITTNLENIIELKATKAETIETSVTIETTDWVEDGVTATYKAVKTVSGVLSSDNPILAFDLDGIADTAWTTSRTEFAKIGLANTTDDNEITFYASAIPTEDITVIVKVVR
jgi:hypothetical protein